MSHPATTTTQRRTVSTRPHPVRAELAALPCRRDDPELWFAEGPAEVERARALCATCPVRLTCLAVAVERAEYAGVWGGQIFERGRIIPHKRARGRPRKHSPAGGGRPGWRQPVMSTLASRAASRMGAAAGNLYDAESALRLAHESGRQAWIVAAERELRQAVSAYLTVLDEERRPPAA